MIASAASRSGCGSTTELLLLVTIAILFSISNVSGLNITVERSLSTYNDSGISTRIVSLAPLASVKLDASNLPSDVKYVLFEAHNQRHNITLSYNDLSNGDLPYDETVTGRDVGLALTLDVSSNNASVWLFNPNSGTEQPLLVLVVVAAHSGTEPLPGGCNLEFHVEISPFLRLQESSVKNIVEFQHARLGAPRGITAPPCDTSFFFLNYDVYAYFLKENDYEEEEYFSGIEIMSKVDSMKKHATKVKPIAFNAAQRTRSVFLSYPGRGVIYNVVASYENYASAYVPIGTYNCDFSSGIEQCGKISSIPAIITVTALAVCGLFVALKGHQWFSIQMIFFGFVGGALPTFVLVAKYTALYPQERDIATLVMGLVGALVWFLVWKIFAFPVLSLLMSGFVLGFLIVASILFTTLGNENLFRNDLNYWMIVGCGCMIAPIVLLPLGVLLSVFASAIVGSYAVCFAADRFVGGTVSYIVLNVLKRAVYDGMYKASNEVPIQAKDVVLLIFWAILAFCGISFQLYGSLDRPSYPAATTDDSSRDRRSRSRSSRSPRSRRVKSGTRGQRRRHRTREAALPIGEDVIVISRRSGPVRPSALPTEHADESQPLLFVVHSTAEHSVHNQESYHAI